MRRFSEVPNPSVADLKEGRDRAEDIFTAKRREEGPRAFERTFEELRPRVLSLFEASDDLTRLDGEVFRHDPDAWQAGRYVTGPPISQEDLWTMVGGPKFRRVPAVLAEETAEALRLVIDPVRFPWLREQRLPDDSERDTAIFATTLLWATQHLGTSRRGEASSAQEAKTGAALASIGLTFDALRSEINMIDDMARFTYSKERRVYGAKCDVPTRLSDGRLLALECKVSNGPKNGWKRVVREVGGKADGWRSEFGSHIITGVVIAGVFDLSALISARSKGVVIFWDHDLGPLLQFVKSTAQQ